MRQSLELERCQAILSEAKPEILLGNACCSDDSVQRGASARNAAAIVQIFIASRAQILVMETPRRFAMTEPWRASIQPQLQMAGCEIETATIKAVAVGVPTNMARMYIVAVKRNGDEGLKPKLQRWKQNMERPAPPPPTVGKYVGKALSS